MNQEGNMRKYTIFCGGINEDGERKLKKKKILFVD